MKNPTFSVKAHWDEDAGVYVSESDIIGLHIEAGTIDEFEEVMLDVAGELIIANHMSAADLAEKPYKELIPAILWHRPKERQGLPDPCQITFIKKSQKRCRIADLTSGRPPRAPTKSGRTRTARSSSSHATSRAVTPLTESSRMPAPARKSKVSPLFPPAVPGAEAEHLPRLFVGQQRLVFAEFAPYRHAWIISLDQFASWQA